MAKREILNICSTIPNSKIDTLALGGFDGLHLGHRALMAELGKHGALLVLEHNYVCLTPGCSRERFSSHPIFILPLETVFALKPNEFIDYLKGNFKNLRRLVVGYDFRFGNSRAAGADDLRVLFDGETIIVPEVKLNGMSVHSTLIRELIIKGDVATAKRLLNRTHFIEGKIINGQGLGATKIYPTLNLETEKFILPRGGVYATRTEIEGKLYRSVSFIGIRETTDNNFSIETHIVDHCANLPNTSYAAIFFEERLRDNKKFDSLEMLKAQISQDIANTKQILEERLCANG
jgi:riboflavin kinase/FMN adenylyltransferase